MTEETLRELRLGSIVKECLPTGDLIVILDKEKLILALNEPDRYEPIDIDYGFLLKNGFEKNNGYDSVRIELEPLKEYGSRTFLVIHCGKHPEAWIDIIHKDVHRAYSELQSNSFKCSYVHELQNLYLSLRGEELTFKK